MSRSVERISEIRPSVDVVLLRPPRIATDRLMSGWREIILVHGLQEYRLRITAAGKLILTK